MASWTAKERCTSVLSFHTALLDCVCVCACACTNGLQTLCEGRWQAGWPRKDAPVTHCFLTTLLKCVCACVWIACSYFVKAGGMLDGEAKDRCTSVYLVDRCARQVPFVVVVLGGIYYDFDGQMPFVVVVWGGI